MNSEKNWFCEKRDDMAKENTSYKKKGKSITNKKIYKKIKKTSIVGSVCSFLFFSLLAVIVMIFAAQQFSKYVFVTKLENEYEIISDMAKIYEGTDGENKSSVFERLDKFGHDYVVVDRSGKVNHVFGEDTRDGKKMVSKIDFDSDAIFIYQDMFNNLIYPSKKGTLALDYRNFYITIYNNKADKTDKASETDKANENDKTDKSDTSDEEDGIIDIGIDYSDEKDVKISESILEFPVWMSIPVKDGNEEFVVKAVFEANMRDFYLLLEIAITIAVLIGVLLFTMLIKAVGSVIKQRKIINYFFKDTVTNGRNWLWFLIKGDQLLKKWSNRNNDYAIVNLVFVNYRNYCVCHSLEKGEEMLYKVYDVINSDMQKGEMCAHGNSSNFALIIKYKSDEEIDQRLRNIIAKLEKIDTDHKFSFQAGVCMVGKTLDDRGYPVKRQDIEIENEYNNACAARATISDSDESGIAYFDEKIVEEQKWLDTVQEKQVQAVQNGEFMVYYQPKYDPRTNELRGAEALIRWQSPELGFVTPGRFIPIFEKNGFITEIDHYMITHVARDQKRWMDKGYKCVPVSVNVSRAHFIESDLAEQIRDMIDGEGCPHNLIEIELTESAFFDDKKAMINTINKLKGYGFAVSMDDFGSGYSSLNSLKDMPLDVLKLDAEFFRGESAEGRGEIVVSEAIKLAKSLNMRTVAEGVEIKEQVDFLASEGCDMIQGYYFAKPMPSNEYETRMRDNAK